MHASQPTYDIDIEVYRRDGSYVLLARRFGVLVRSSDLKKGIEELELRVEAVAKDLSEFPPAPTINPPTIATAGTERPVNLRLDILLSIVAAALVAAFFIFIATIPFVNATITLRNTVYELVGPHANVDKVGRAAINVLVQLGDAAEKMTPQRKEELTAAIRKIARGVAPIAREIREASEPGQTLSPNR